MRSVSLVVTDLDGTLWDRNELIHDRTLDALQKLDALDVPVLVATGRRLRSARQRLVADGLHLPIVALDGALGRDGERTFHRRTFAIDDATEVVDAFAASGLSPCLYVDRDDVDIVIGARPSTAPAHLRIINGYSATGDIATAARQEAVYAFGVYGATGAAETALARLAAQLQGRFEIQGGPDGYLGGYSLMVYPAGTTKWAGVESFCDDQALDVSRVLALGDGPNDLALLSGAAIACVVSDGCEPALALADHVIDPASSGGWARVLDLV